MNFTDFISMAVQHAFDLDTPEDQLPLCITQDACLLAGLESDRIGCASWTD